MKTTRPIETVSADHDRIRQAHTFGPSGNNGKSLRVQSRLPLYPFPDRKIKGETNLDTLQVAFSKFVLLWAVIDPIGTIPVFVSATAERTTAERRRIALIAAVTAAGILLFFIIAGEPMLRSMGVPLLAFQIAGGIVLFLFALTMIFGESKPDEEKKLIRSIQDTAVFPLATPSIASPGAMMAVVLLTENQQHTLLDQATTAIIVLLILLITFGLMLASGTISRIIGSGGASIVSRVMGMILASVASAQVLEGLKEYFLTPGP